MKYLWRLRILLYWLKDRRQNVSLGSLFKNIFAPRFKQRAGKYIDSINEENGDYIVTIRKCSSPLYFPKNIGLDALYHVVCEICDKYDWHFYEIPETRVQADDIVVDCGAAEGLFSLIVKDRCQHVYIIEPLSNFLQSLSKTFLKFNNVTIIPMALGSSAGKVYITNEGMETKISSIPTENIIKIETIDNLFFHQNKKITYIKADIEGYELEMLKGARLTIERYHPTIAITTYHHLADAHLISIFLKNISPEYKIITKGIDDKTGAPKLLHAWIK